MTSNASPRVIYAIIAAGGVVREGYCYTYLAMGGDPISPGALSLLSNKNGSHSLSSTTNLENRNLLK